jgi:hypothetical protein
MSARKFWDEYGNDLVLIGVVMVLIVLIVVLEIHVRNLRQNLVLDRVNCVRGDVDLEVSTACLSARFRALPKYGQAYARKRPGISRTNRLALRSSARLL